ncbi:MAG TPA: thiamine phosphate synthase [Silvibacterium sp.]|nr:thiamine phosphate synthase [Silvibacterium sp.]
MVPAKFPPLYPILDAVFLPVDPVQRNETLIELVTGLAEAGVAILQYRNKQGSDVEILRDAGTIRMAATPNLRLILNDFPHLVTEAGFDGVHVGQQDMTPREARRLVGTERIVGISTHNEAQLRAADLEPVDYIAIGPVFATSSKQNPDPVVGIEGVRLARHLTSKPVVAIGGITLQNAPQVWGSGADSIAVISAIFSTGVDTAKSAGDFLRLFQQKVEVRLHG